MPYQLDFNTNVIQIMGGHFYIDTLCGTDYKWVPLVPKTNGYFNQMCHYNAIVLTFVILFQKLIQILSSIKNPMRLVFMPK